MPDTTEAKSGAASPATPADTIVRAAAPIRISRPKIDLHALSTADFESLPRYWWGGSPFKTHFLNAFSSTLPFGEAFFVRSVRHYTGLITEPALIEGIRGFAGQEGQHSRLHDDHVDLLVRQGYGALAKRNEIIDRILKWQNKKAPRFSLASTSAIEHLTAILARQVLKDPFGRVEEMHPDMARLWRWHALEEAEHKAVAYDVMEVAKIPRWIRNVTMVLNTFGLALETWERMIYMMWKDGRLFEVKTWMSGLGFLFGKDGFLRGTWSEYSAWYRADFHPNDIDDREMITQLAPAITAEIA